MVVRQDVPERGWFTAPRSIVAAAFIYNALEGSFAFAYLAYLIHGTGSAGAANLVNAFFWVAMTVVEIPTGYVTDRLGPKLSFALSIAIRICGFVIFLTLSRSIAAIALANVVAGVAVTLSTGVFQTQIRLYARQSGVDVDYAKFSTRFMTVSYAGAAFGGVFGAWATSRYGVVNIWAVALAFSAILLAFVLATWENLRGGTSLHVVDHFRAAMTAISRNPHLRLLAILRPALMMISIPLVENWTAVYVPSLDKTPMLLVGAFVVVNTLRGLASNLWLRMHQRIPQPRLVNTLLLFASSYLAAALLPQPFSAALFLLALLALSGAFIELMTIGTAALPPSESATVSSIISLIENIGGSVALVLCGLLIFKIGILGSWMVAAGGFLLIAIVWRCTFPRGRQAPAS